MLLKNAALSHALVMFVDYKICHVSIPIIYTLALDKHVHIFALVKFSQEVETSKDLEI